MKRFAILWTRQVRGAVVTDVIWHVVAESETAALVVAHRFIPKSARPLEAKEETS